MWDESTTYTAFELAVTHQISWQYLIEALEPFKVIRSLTIEFGRASASDREWSEPSILKLDTARCTAIFYRVAEQRLPKKYMEILHVKEAYVYEV